MFHPLRHHKHFAGLQGHCSIPELDVDFTRENKEKIICVLMRVPPEFPLDFNHHNVMAVERRDCSR